MQTNEPLGRSNRCPVAGDRTRSMEPNTLGAQLREATRAAHHGLDHHLMLAPLVWSALQRAHYIKLLRAFSWIYATLDPALEEALSRLCPDSGFQPSDRRRWLAEDLAYFQLKPEPSSSLWQVPAIDSIAALIGRMYVIEGSTLGGQVIARQLAWSIDAGPDSGGRLFHGHGETTPTRWQDFMTFSESACPPAEFEVACDAANTMFVEFANLLDLWFEQWGTA